LKDEMIINKTIKKMDTIFYSQQKPFNKTDVLFDNGSNQLDVAGLLKVTRYAEKTIKIIDPKADDNELNLALEAFNSVGFALNNKPTDKPTQEALHCVNDVLHKVVRSQLSKESDKQFASGMSLLVTLAIDLFCKK